MQQTMRKSARNLPPGPCKAPERKHPFIFSGAKGTAVQAELAAMHIQGRLVMLKQTLVAAALAFAFTSGAAYAAAPAPAADGSTQAAPAQNNAGAKKMKSHKAKTGNHAGGAEGGNK